MLKITTFIYDVLYYMTNIIVGCKKSKTQRQKAVHLLCLQNLGLAVARRTVLAL